MAKNIFQLIVVVRRPEETSRKKRQKERERERERENRFLQVRVRE